MESRMRRTRKEAHAEQQTISGKCNDMADVLNYMKHDLLLTLGLVNQFPKRKYTSILPAINRLIYSGGKTIIIWGDGDKTIVSCGEGEDFDHYTGFCAAIVKKVFGSTTAAKKVMNNFLKGIEHNEKI